MRIKILVLLSISFLIFINNVNYTYAFCAPEPFKKKACNIYREFGEYVDISGLLETNLNLYQVALNCIRREASFFIYAYMDNHEILCIPEGNEIIMSAVIDHISELQDFKRTNREATLRQLHRKSWEIVKSIVDDNEKYPTKHYREPIEIPDLPILGDRL